MLLRKKRLIYFYLLFIFSTVFSPLASAENIRRTFFVVDNLSCGSCLIKIDRNLKTLDGYIGMLANLNKKLMAIDHNESLKESRILEAITILGYSASLASESEYDHQKTVSTKTSGWRSPTEGFFYRVLKIINH